MELPPGPKPPEEIYVVVEIPLGGRVKYEIDHENGALVVNRFLRTPMLYPANYGFVPSTLAMDGDPLDVLVISREAVVPGAVIPARPIGVLLMEDENGKDEKIIAVPLESVDSSWVHVKDIKDCPQAILEEIEHFFEHYKDKEPGKWTKLRGFKGREEALKLIQDAIARWQTTM